MRACNIALLALAASSCGALALTSQQQYSIGDQLLSPNPFSDKYDVDKYSDWSSANSQYYSSDDEQYGEFNSNKSNYGKTIASTNPSVATWPYSEPPKTKPLGTESRRNSEPSSTIAQTDKNTGQEDNFKATNPHISPLNQPPSPPLTAYNPSSALQVVRQTPKYLAEQTRPNSPSAAYVYGAATISRETMPLAAQWCDETMELVVAKRDASESSSKFRKWFSPKGVVKSARFAINYAGLLFGKDATVVNAQSRLKNIFKAYSANVSSPYLIGPEKEMDTRGSMHLKFDWGENGYSAKLIPVEPDDYVHVGRKTYNALEDSMIEFLDDPLDKTMYEFLRTCNTDI
ncbi:hypothetical protein H4R33_003702 [Dimargaris cristalligena]|uniref:Uncharacterized protein n=1 Tax=Dimargaris cristalligena TaxID=215637 RepID=A0A4P9ZYC4_9FUNG|nr:hypothetical protein H4R33_003702 [Dimargaris cristalligena]RKP38693.1 hypothetical protein BJ085DRAFT_29948 [Dimargaris cristalligena]|eukprot:RKP38693.1 hypothetical protein BJ085DRAFT_29948 [Dimargaris cristalligena]